MGTLKKKKSDFLLYEKDHYGEQINHLDLILIFDYIYILGNKLQHLNNKNTNKRNIGFCPLINFNFVLFA